MQVEVPLQPAPSPSLATILNTLFPPFQHALRLLMKSKKEIINVDDVLLLSHAEIQKITLLSPVQVTSLLGDLSALVVDGVDGCTTAYQLCMSAEARRRLSLGDKILDDLFQGGILPRGITEIAGEAGCGKTQVCLQLLFQAQLPFEYGGLEGSAVYFGTEGEIPLKRLTQIARHYQYQRFLQIIKQEDGTTINASIFQDYDFLSNIFLEKVANLDSMWHILSQRIAQLIANPRGNSPIRLLVIDSIAALFRFEYKMDEAVERSKMLWNIANQLKFISDKYNIAVVVVNQVTDFFMNEVRYHAIPTHKNQKEQLMPTVTKSSTGRVVPSLGLSWTNNINSRIMLTRSRRTWSSNNKRKFEETEEHETNTNCHALDLAIRKMRVVLSSHLPDACCSFVVDSDGVRGVSEVDEDAP